MLVAVHGAKTLGEAIFVTNERIKRKSHHTLEKQSSSRIACAQCEQLVNLSRIVLRLAQNPHTRPTFAEFNQCGNANVEMLLFLLTTKNYHVLQSSLRALLELAQSDDTVGVLSRHLQEHSLHHLLEIIQE